MRTADWSCRKQSISYCCAVADPDLVKQIGTKSFMKFHNHPQPIMRFHHGSQTEFEEAGMLFAR